jgi:glucokinase
MAKYTLGLDIGGTKIQAGLVSKENKITRKQRVIYRGKNKSSVLRGIYEAIDSIFSSEVGAIGVGITGEVDISSGVVKYSPNLPRDWKNVKLKKILRKKYGVPVSIDNDAHCIALAEAYFGAGRGYPVVVGMTIGTGIGISLIINGHIYRGANNIIEFGHTITGNPAQKCSCGLLGHFEALVSGPAMTREYKKLTGLAKTPQNIEIAARHGDRRAKKVFKEMSTNLARGLADVIHSYNPSIIVLGGGLGRVDILTDPAIKQIRNYIKYPGLKNTKVVKSRLKYEAGILGAALIARKNN